MLKKNKRGTEESLLNLVRIVMVVMFFLALTTVAVKVWFSVQGVPVSQQQENHFNAFFSQVNRLSYLNKDYSSTYAQIYMFSDYYLVGFGTRSNLEGDITLIKPSSCDALKPCICIYDGKPNPLKPKENLLNCKKLPKVDHILASHLFEESIILPSKENKDNNYSFSSPAGKFLGNKLTDSEFSSSINEFIKSKQANSADSTKYMGFDSPLKYHNFIVKAPSLSSLKFYVEQLKIKNQVFLVFFPYTSGLNNRKYFLQKYAGEGECNNMYLHTAIKVQGEPENYTYCELQGDKLVSSDEKINLCESSEVSELCVCTFNTRNTEYPRAISSGYCFETYFDSRINQATSLLINFPPKSILCGKINELKNKGEDTKCEYYRDRNFCELDICDIGPTCEWDVASEKCVVSTTTTPNPPGNGIINVCADNIDNDADGYPDSFDSSCICGLARGLVVTDLSEEGLCLTGSCNNANDCASSNCNRFCIN